MLRAGAIAKLINYLQKANSRHFAAAHAALHKIRFRCLGVEALPEAGLEEDASANAGSGSSYTR
ncbi:MAG: hypothetical protein CL949_22780 [Erythrobacter sp.]|nr:hypothetical protein [Erythrobacter sp.]